MPAHGMDNNSLLFCWIISLLVKRYEHAYGDLPNNWTADQHYSGSSEMTDRSCTCAIYYWSTILLQVTLQTSLSSQSLALVAYWQP